MLRVSDRKFGAGIFWAGFVGFLIGIIFSLGFWAAHRVLDTNQQLANSGYVSGTINKPTPNTTVKPTASSAATVKPTASGAATTTK